MRQQWHSFHTRVQRVLFGSPYHPADHNALSPRGSKRGIRLVLIVVGTIWSTLVVLDNLARPWQRHPKSWAFFQGPRELNESPNQPLARDAMTNSDVLARDIGVSAVTRPYTAAEDSTSYDHATDAQGFRTVRSQPPYNAVLCGDSFSNNNVLADSLAATTGLSIANRAIEGRGTLSMARYLEDSLPLPHKVHLVFWESTQRNGVAEFGSIASRRSYLQQTAGQYFDWKKSLLWPTNLDAYFNGSSLIKPLLDRVQKEVKWSLLHQHTNLILAGRLNLPPAHAPMLFLAAEEGIRPRATQKSELDSIANYVAGIAHELRQRGQQLIYFTAPEKSYVYNERLPAGMTARNNYITGLTQALQQRGVYTVNLSQGLRQAALKDPTHLYYYTADTHWTPRGMAVASRIIADSLTSWHLIRPRRIP